MTLTIQHACVGAVIQTKTMTPADYQIHFSGTQMNILSFTMHQDSLGISQNNPIYCGAKKYTSDLFWLSIYKPTNVLTD